MTTCPAGHDSATDDYCDVCGLAVEAPTAPFPAPPPPVPAVETCARCGAERPGRFCEECGHDAALPVPGPEAGAPGEAQAAGPDRAVPSGWTAVVRADRAWFEEVRHREGPDAASVDFPRYCPERRFELTGGQVAIGRRSRSRGTAPEIDLSGPPLDPGVSAQHALLLARPDGGWDLVDLDSTNGTSIGDTDEPIAPHTPVPLADGDRIRLGAWTTITVGRPGQSR